MKENKETFSPYVGMSADGARQFLYKFLSEKGKQKFLEILIEYGYDYCLNDEEEINFQLNRQHFVAIMKQRLHRFEAEENKYDAEFIRYFYKEPIKTLDLESWQVEVFADGDLLTYNMNSYPIPDSIEGFMEWNWTEYSVAVKKRDRHQKLNQTEKNWLYLVDVLKSRK